MRLLLPSLLLIAAALALSPLARAQAVLENGNFDGADPLKGWITDYAFDGNSNYMANKTFVSVVQEGARKNVVKFGSNGEAGVKLESKAFPLESGFKYTCSVDIKGAGYRIYFAGYQWAPGIRPHDAPELVELRKIYQSKAVTSASKDWKTEKLEIPGVTLSAEALEHFKKIRFLTIYIWMHDPGFVDNVVLTKVPDPSMKSQ